MTFHVLTLILLAQAALVAGQVCLKHGMSRVGAKTGRAGRPTGFVSAGVALLALWFFLWMGLLQKLDLSYVYPFEGLSPMLLVIAASVMLKESLSWQSWIGAGLITIGTIFVGLS